MIISALIDTIIALEQADNVLFVSICGAADTGKSTIAKKACDALRKENIECDFICTDSFMIDRESRIRSGISGYNVKSLKEEELPALLEDVQQKRTAKYFPYDNRIGKNASAFKMIQHVDVLIVEGIHSFHEIIRNKIALKIFIDADDKTLRTLRYKANIIKRGFSEDDAMKRIDLEMDEYYQFLHPNKKYADKIINVDENFNYQFAEPS